MDIVTHVLYWVKFWEWPGRIVKFMEQWHAYRKAKFEADVAKASKTNALREIQIVDMMQAIRNLTNRSAAENPGRQVFLDIKPGPDDDPEIFHEAMRRIKQELRPQR